VIRSPLFIALDFTSTAISTDIPSPDHPGGTGPAAIRTPPGPPGGSGFST
jgi:hypothetical protein